MTAAPLARTCLSCSTLLSRYNSEYMCGPCAKGDQSIASAPVAASAPWLWVGSRRPSPPDSSNIGEILKAWRKVHGLRQAEVAERLSWSQSYISQIESGRAKVRDVQQLWHLQRVLDIPPAELGLLLDQSAENVPTTGTPVGRIAAKNSHSTAVVNSQRAWLAVRAALNGDRRVLAEAAASLYPDSVRVAGTTMIAHPDWLLDEPVEFDDVHLEWLVDVARPLVNGSEPEAVALRPLDDQGAVFGKYSHAVRELARPTLFENRPGYRLMEVTAGTVPTLAFGYTSYFESIVDTSGALAHEYAAVAGNGTPRMEQLPFRSLIGDPFDLRRRSLMPSINTLTIRKDGDKSTFLLHYRDPANVAATAGVYHVMPAGMFQPSSIAPWHQANDFSLWRSSLREFAEELLDLPEADGSSPEPIDYDSEEPFASMEAARVAGKFRMWFYGIGMDPLTLYGEILSIAVVDADAFDSLFAELATINHEGSLVSADERDPRAGIPFTSELVHRLIEHEPLAPPAIALLRLAWRDRARLLG